MIESWNCPGKHCSDPVTLFRLGIVDAVDTFVKKYPDTYKRLGLIDSARLLVSLEILDAPKHVGSPIDIVRITNDNKVEWVQKKKGCGEIKPSMKDNQKLPSNRADKQRKKSR